MKNIIFVCVLIFIISCKENYPFYHGVVIDEKNKPIKNVIIKEFKYEHVQYTNTLKNGEFTIYKTPDYTTSLIFLKKGYITDTIETITMLDGGQTRFLNQIADTLVLKLENNSKEKGIDILKLN